YLRESCICLSALYIFFFSSRRRHTRSKRDWSSDVCSSDLLELALAPRRRVRLLLLDQIPLVHGDDDRRTPLPRIVGNLQVLDVHPILRIHHQDADVGALDRSGRPKRRVELDVVLDLAALAEPRGVDE